MSAVQIAADANLNDEELEKLGALYEKAAPETVLRWAIQRFGKRVAIATGFGLEGCVLVHMLADIDPNGRVFYLDTDLLFRETYELRDRLETRYGVRFERRSADLSLSRQAVLHGDRLWASDPDGCCHLRKMQPLVSALSGLDAWITAIRRSQTADRSNAKVVEWDAKFGLVKINPLARWSSKDVWNFIADNNVPYNPLHDQGYPSIGCRPCTTPVRIGESDRSGRWRGVTKTECGLHRP